MKKSLLIIIFLLLIGIGVAFFVKFPKTHTTNTQVQETQLSGDNEVIQSGDNQGFTGNNDRNQGDIVSQGEKTIYINTGLNFQFDLPNISNQYKIFSYTINNQEGVSNNISITLPTADPLWKGIRSPQDPIYSNNHYTGKAEYITGYANIISFSIWNDEKFKNNSCRYKDVSTLGGGEMECLGDSEIIGQTDKYYIIYNGPVGSWGGLPYDLQQQLSTGYIYDIFSSFSTL